MDNGKGNGIIKRIVVYGIVQGVGFRPLVYRLAKKYGIRGTVRNLGGIVEILAQSGKKELEAFLGELQSEHKGSYEIQKLVIEDYKKEVGKEKEAAIYFPDFKILPSREREEISIIPPDLSVCSDCQRELSDSKDRRYRNPFISCMSCGPRYTIIEELPYDREKTVMRDFALCSSCQKEYTSPESRRFHAQTISCNDCGPYLIYRQMGKEKSLQENRKLNRELFDQAALGKAVEVLKAGGILAVKGIGGFHLVCSPFLQATVMNLRKLKGREEKPFAVMFPNTDTVKTCCILTKEGKELLESKERPVVLLYSAGHSMAEAVNKGSIYTGAFLPCTPLQILLTKECGPLIMTSANPSNQPIIREEEKIFELDSSYLSGILYNKRRILRSVDDSVARILNGTPQLIRRSRGYVPYPIFLPEKERKVQLFAAGGDLKAAFCLYKDGKAVVSQYFGDLEEMRVLEEYGKSVQDLASLLKIKPDFALCDLHPNYHSTDYTKSLGIPVLFVQHHHAHIASVMAEHNLSEVIGIAFDGTGYGTDGAVWGGEFLLCRDGTFQRKAHLSYTPIIGGDSSMKDAKKTASCYLIHNGLEAYCKDRRKAVIKAALDKRINTVMTSSMGRLFDTVSALLGLGEENRYEGECAILLEKAAWQALQENRQPAKLVFAIHEKGDMMELDSKLVLADLCREREVTDIGSLALGFHYAVAGMLVTVCEILRKEEKISTVALGGGVFQNTILTELAIKLLQERGFKVCVNRLVPPNDGSISLGQTFIGLRQKR